MPMTTAELVEQFEEVKRRLWSSTDALKVSEELRAELVEERDMLKTALKAATEKISRIER